MARLEDVAFRAAVWHEIDTTVNAVCSATHAAETGHRHLITGWTISTSATPINSGTLYVKDGASNIEQLEINADTPTPLRSSERWLLTAGNAAVITVSALGAGIQATVVLHGCTVDG